MRHQVKSKKLGKDSKHRKALLRNLATSFFRSEEIQTTLVKARQLRPFAEKLITRAKVDSLHNRRLVYRHLRSKSVLKKLFENLALRYQNRPGGYTRIYKVQARKGDASPMAVIQLVPEQLNPSEGKGGAVGSEGTSDSVEAPSSASEPKQEKKASAKGSS